MEICSRGGLLMLTRCPPSIYRGLSLHGNTFLQEPPGRGRLDITAIWLGKKKKNHRGKTSRQIFPFISLSRQESQDVCLLYFMSRKSIAEGFLLGDLCFMKFMPGAERQAGELEMIAPSSSPLLL